MRKFLLLSFLFLLCSSAANAEWTVNKSGITDDDIFPFQDTSAPAGQKTGYISGILLKNYVLRDVHTTPLTASMVTGVFPGTGDCLGSNGEKVACGGSGSFAYDTFPTYSDSPHSSGIAKNNTHVAIYSGETNGWGVAALTFSLNPTPIAPTLTSRVIGTDGTTLTLTGSASLSVGAGGSSGFDVDCALAGSDIAATYDSGTPGTSLVYTLATPAFREADGESCNLDYTQPGNGIEATTGGADLVSITSAATTNNSTQIAISYLVNEDFNTGAAPSGWTPADVTKIYNHTPAIEGAYSVRVDGDTGVDTQVHTALTTYHLSFKFTPITLPSNFSNQLRFTVSGLESTHVVNLYANGSMLLGLNGVMGSNAAGTIVAGTTYDCEVTITPGTGTGTGQLRVKAVGSETWVVTNLTGVTFTAGVTQTRFRGAPGASIVYDTIKVY